MIVTMYLYIAVIVLMNIWFVLFLTCVVGVSFGTTWKDMGPRMALRLAQSQLCEQSQRHFKLSSIMTQIVAEANFAKISIFET